jgi:phosphoglucomutase
MDANLISLCGEESFGTGSNHIREKDGILSNFLIKLIKLIYYKKLKVFKKYIIFILLF